MGERSNLGFIYSYSFNHILRDYILISKPSNHTWAVCPHGYFLQGFDRSYGTGTGLHNIKQAACCRPRNFKTVPLDCYDHNVTVSIAKAGWSKCQDWSYLAGVYKGACNKLHCIETFRCCRMPPQGICALCTLLRTICKHESTTVLYLKIFPHVPILIRLHINNLNYK